MATGVYDEVYMADPAEVPLSDVVAPPAFAACFTVGRGAVFADPDLGVHPNLVHGSQSYDYSRPIRGGDVLSCTPVIVDIVERDRMELLTYAIDCVDDRTQEHVLTSTSTLILFKTAEG